MSLETTIKLIPASQTYYVRQTVLRPGMPLQECVFEGDADDTTFHLGIFKREQIIGVARYLQVEHNLFTSPNQYQLRGMAVLPSYIGNGYGKALLQEGETRLRTSYNSPLLWFNARENAIEFYKN